MRTRSRASSPQSGEPKARSGAPTARIDLRAGSPRTQCPHLLSTLKIIELLPSKQIDAETIVDRAIERFALESKKFPLTKYRGSTHWHLRKKGCKGTIEVTHWPAEKRLWISLREDRHGEWIEEILPDLISFLNDPA